MRECIKIIYNEFFNPLNRDRYIAYLIRNVPGEIGVALREVWFRKKFKRAGVNLRVLEGTTILNPDKIECGDNVIIGVSNYIQAAGGLNIKSEAMLGPYVKIWTANHNFGDVNIPILKQGYTFKSVEIGQGVWIGASAFLMPGARIGDKSIVSACSVVGGKAYPDNIILGGHPARIIGSRNAKVKEEK